MSLATSLKPAIAPVHAQGDGPLLTNGSTLANSGPPSPTGAYVSLIDKINTKIAAKERWFSFEFFPPKTLSGASNLLERFEHMQKGGPLFCDITWHSGGDPGGEQLTSSIQIASTMLNFCGMEAMLHMTCCNLTKEQTTVFLEKAKSRGIRNILALRGDPPKGMTWSAMPGGFRYATDLVRHIRAEFGDYFNICVAGYPTGHPDSESYEDDLLHLKEKVDAGADFIITQLFFEAHVFLKYVADCRAIGITCPIIPGIMPIQGYATICNIVRISKITVPQQILDDMELIKDNEHAIREYGVKQAEELIRELFDNGVHGVHIYTLNREVASLKIVKRLGLWQKVHRTLPWKTSGHHKRRASEDVRPIFWALRPKSYIHRTLDWDDYPNGRWGNSESPAFGEMSDYHLFYLRPNVAKEDLLQIWGPELKTDTQVFSVFKNFLTGEENEHGKKVTTLPWNEGHEELHKETFTLQDKLVRVNERGILTINSQPNVNGAPSDDPTFGWGEKYGYVYQKAYVEFFTSSKNARALLTVLKDYPQVNYHIINHSGDIDMLNYDWVKPIAVTWGVFPGQEIVQPTVVDPQTFRIWKTESFGLWLANWGHVYEDDSESRKVIQQIHDTYLLVNLVDNDFPKDSCLWEIIDKALELQETATEDLLATLETVSLATHAHDDGNTSSSSDDESELR